MDAALSGQISYRKEEIIMFAASAMLYEMTINKNEKHITLLLQVLSSADLWFIKNIQSLAEHCLEEGNIQSWENAEVVVFYLGMTPLPSKQDFTLPNGLPVRFFNLNLSSLPREMKFLRPYAILESNIRKLLLQGLSPEEVYQKVSKNRKLTKFFKDIGGEDDTLLRDITRFQEVLEKEGWI